ncbi:type II toxin-antitoxin system VapB family antitoxin [Mesorhizobium sp. AR10]|uniref:type II toxin-antitoxin system VapB family antitoxin n=1 Tax=Mesorhizobium sp. AR10 TaxID=2865839 RepID=UPI002160E1BE|nr:type II toxin-antitoxin system VapB family antitoxin [Mesorhizobium sp. AR10]UVK38711.1 type II toxin-antitoxin system VapB family antitoxin [Mesorhizobium sp. AR10]
MNLQIRDPRARALARELAAKRKISMTEAVIEALESELKRESGRVPLAERLAVIANEFKARAGEGGRAVNKDEIDDMWGHP